MTSRPYEHVVSSPGEPVEQSVTDLLSSDDDGRAERLQEQLDRIRDSERSAETQAAAIRLY